jgi:hypothetical protein
LNQVPAIGYEEAIAIEVGEHPFMRVERVAVGKLDAIVNEAKFRTKRGRTAHGGVYM